MKKGPLDYLGRWPLRLWLLGVAVFLYTPLLVVIIFSFNDSRRVIRWEGFTLGWYEKLLANQSLIDAYVNSLTIAAATTVVSVVLAICAGVALWRGRIPGLPLFEAGLSLPIVVPEICLGAAFLLFFGQLGIIGKGDWPWNLLPIVAAHATFCFPFATVIIRARLASFDRAQEEAAHDLGASGWQTFRHVLIPHLLPAIIASALLCMALSLDDFIITFFTAGPETVTFPVKIYSMVRFSVTPEVNAASTILIVLTASMAVLALVLQKPEEAAK